MKVCDKCKGTAPKDQDEEDKFHRERVKCQLVLTDHAQRRHEFDLCEKCSDDAYEWVTGNEVPPIL